MTSLHDLHRHRPGNRENIDQIKAGMYADAKAYRLRTFREESGLTQESLAKKIGVGQNRISQMEHGHLTSARVSTIQKYVAALGGSLELTVKRADGSTVTLPVEEDLEDLSDSK